MLNVMKVLTQKNIMSMFPVVMLIKIVCIDDKYSKSIVFYRGVNAAYKFIKPILEEHKYRKINYVIESIFIVQQKIK